MDPRQRLARSFAQMLPMQRGRVPRMTISVDAAEATEMEVQLRISSKRDNHTPDVTLETLKFDLPSR